MAVPCGAEPVLTGVIPDIDAEVWRNDTAILQRHTIASGGDGRPRSGVFHYDELVRAPFRKRAHLFTVDCDRITSNHFGQK